MLATPSLRERVLPLLLFGWLLAATRLTLDATIPNSELTMWFGLYYGMPIALAWVGLTFRWGAIRWTSMAWTMLVLGFTVWGVWSAIAYTIGQFMEWEHGRFFGGTPTEQPDGTIENVGARADAVHDDALAKIGAGLLHGVLSSVASTVWCTGIGTVLIWLPARLRSRTEEP